MGFQMVELSSIYACLATGMKNCAFSAHVSRLFGSVNSTFSQHQVSGTGSCLCLGRFLLCVISVLCAVCLCIISSS